MQRTSYKLILLFLFVGGSLLAQTEQRPVQVVPSDGEVVNTFYPQFVWLPVAKPGDSKLTYTIRVAELKEGQSYADAIQQNVPVWEQRDITSTSVTYGIDGTALNEDSKYVWQIASLVSNGVVALSDIWMFKYKKVPTPKDSVLKKLVLPRPFPELTLNLSSNTHTIRDTIQFFYENYSRQDSVELTINKHTLKRESETGVIFKGKIALGRDKNYIQLKQVNTQKWTTKKVDPTCYYVLQFTNLRNESWKLKFQLTGKDDAEEQKIKELINSMQKGSK